MARSSQPPAASARRSSCPISCALDLLGDRWTLLIIRDLFRGRTRYNELLAAHEGIPTNILADRLKRLQRAGLIRSKPYQQNPPRYAYTLTPKGDALKTVLGALAQWSISHLRGTQDDPELAAMLRAQAGQRA